MLRKASKTGLEEPNDQLERAVGSNAWYLGEVRAQLVLKNYRPEDPDV